MKLLGVFAIIGGTWIFQDALASILYYLKKTNENWYYNQALRVLRGIWSLFFICLGIYLLMN